MSADAIRRLQKELQAIKRNPPDNIVAVPDESNILNWHYCIKGPKDTPYEGGYYHGKLKFPPEYPFAPPSIIMITPNGRFKTDTRLCLSMSDFHPKEWNPLWSVSSILVGLLSFMVESKQTHGSIESPDTIKKQFAVTSLEFNLRSVTFTTHFSDLTAEIKQKLAAQKAEAANKHGVGAGEGRVSASPRGLLHQLVGILQSLMFLVACVTVMYLVV
jgi:ubiquitin-conjugating enzyme E2 J2